MRGYRLALRGVLLLPLFLAGCGGDDTPPPVFAPLHYEYLTRIRLNVGAIDVEDHSAALPDDLAAEAPTPPAAALARMAHDRLFAAGTSGQAVFTIDQASIQREPGGTLDGVLAAHLDIIDAAGGHAGYAEARVARQHVPGSDEENRTAMLYDLTQQMMGEMNVELEFQVRRTLKTWLVPDSATVAPVAAQPLETPLSPLPGATPGGYTPGDVAPPAYAPPASGVPSGATPPQLSPPPGYLQLPQGYPQPGYPPPQ